MSACKLFIAQKLSVLKMLRWMAFWQQWIMLSKNLPLIWKLIWWMPKLPSGSETPKQCVYWGLMPSAILVWSLYPMRRGVHTIRKWFILHPIFLWYIWFQYWIVLEMRTKFFHFCRLKNLQKRSLLKLRRSIRIHSSSMQKMFQQWILAFWLLLSPKRMSRLQCFFWKMP